MTNEMPPILSKPCPQALTVCTLLNSMQHEHTLYNSKEVVVRCLSQQVKASLVTQVCPRNHIKGEE